MRRLYFVPILHMSADMGSLASALDAKTKAELGSGLWQKHKETVSAFWDSIAHFFDTLNANGFKIYQDGMVADGEDGLRIVREGASQGSKNYEIVGKLLKMGAVLVRAEDLALIRQEHALATRIAGLRRLDRSETRSLRYDQSRLLGQRDDFVADRIKQTLVADNETGVLFIGAYHDILSRLPDDIQVIQVKDLAKVREYHRALEVAVARKYSQRLNQLAFYLTSPVSVPS